MDERRAPPPPSSGSSEVVKRRPWIPPRLESSIEVLDDVRNFKYIPPEGAGPTLAEQNTS